MGSRQADGTGRRQMGGLKSERDSCHNPASARERPQAEGAVFAPHFGR